MFLNVKALISIRYININGAFCTAINPLTPNDPYSGRTAPITSKHYILYIYSTNIGTQYFKHCIHSPFLSLQSAVCFIILTYLVPVLFTFCIQSVLKLKRILRQTVNSVQFSHLNPSIARGNHQWRGAAPVFGGKGVQMIIGVHRFLSNVNKSSVNTTVYEGTPYTVNYTHAQRVRICCHYTDLVHVNGHDRIILVVFSQALYKAP